MWICNLTLGYSHVFVCVCSSSCVCPPGCSSSQFFSLSSKNFLAFVSCLRNFLTALPPLDGTTYQPFPRLGPKNHFHDCLSVCRHSTFLHLRGGQPIPFDVADLGEGGATKWLFHAHSVFRRRKVCGRSHELYCAPWASYNYCSRMFSRECVVLVAPPHTRRIYQRTGRLFSSHPSARVSASSTRERREIIYDWNLRLQFCCGVVSLVMLLPRVGPE